MRRKRAPGAAVRKIRLLIRAAMGVFILAACARVGLQSCVNSQDMCANIQAQIASLFEKLSME
jgi:hypothetical protein